MTIELVDKSNIEKKYKKPQKQWNETNTCERCGNKLERTSSGCHPTQLYDNGIPTGKYICHICNGKIYYKESYLTDRKINNLKIDSSQVKGDNFEELTCIWRSTISSVIVENLNKKLNNYITPIDHSPDSELGIIQTKGAFYNSYHQRWSQNFRNLHNTIINGFNFDFLILYCASEDGKIIARIYIIPKEETMSRTGITINKNPSNRNGRCPEGAWYEKYRVTDEESIKKINQIWKQILDDRSK